MGRWTRAELEDAFANFQKVALHAGTTGDWAAWADLFAEDATYIESNYGRMGGRAAIKKRIVATITRPPANDTGDGSMHQAYNFTLLKYAGDGLWAYEEDIYDPKHFQSMMVGWFEAKKKLEAAK